MPAAYVGLGANLGDRRATLQGAVGALGSRGVRALASSSVYATDPVGRVLDQPEFLNACLEVETALAPLDLLAAAKDVEAELGRDFATERHGPRVIDIDILLLGSERVDEPGLMVPHPALLTRRFVLIPLLELDFTLTTPDGAALADALAVLPVDEGVRRAGPPLAV